MSYFLEANEGYLDLFMPCGDGNIWIMHTIPSISVPQRSQFSARELEIGVPKIAMVALKTATDTDTVCSLLPPY